MPFISYGDYVGGNQDQIRQMEEQLRAEEQRKLSSGLNAVQSAGAESKDSAYWGGSGNTADYASWKEANDKRDAAMQFQNDISNDAGQLNQLNKLSGGKGNLDAALVFGSNKSDQTKTSLAEYMGYDAKKLDELATKYGDETEANAADYKKEKGLYDAGVEQDKKFSDWNAKKMGDEGEYWSGIEGQLKGYAGDQSRELTEDEKRKMYLNPGMHDPRFTREKTQLEKTQSYYMTGSEDGFQNPMQNNRGERAVLNVLNQQIQSLPAGDPRRQQLLESARQLMERSGMLEGSGIQDVMARGATKQGKYHSLNDYMTDKGNDPSAPEHGKYGGRLAYGKESWNRRGTYPSDGTRID